VASAIGDRGAVQELRHRLDDDTLGPSRIVHKAPEVAHVARQQVGRTGLQRGGEDRLILLGQGQRARPWA
jgi:hypothetical protein